MSRKLRNRSNSEEAIDLAANVNDLTLAAVSTTQNQTSGTLLSRKWHSYWSSGQCINTDNSVLPGNQVSNGPGCISLVNNNKILGVMMMWCVA